MEAAGSSPIYERTARAVAVDGELIKLVEALPPAKRQPNLLFASCRFLDAPFDDTAKTIEFIHTRWSDISALMQDRSTQTNEPARTATFLPLIAALDGPIALIEVGASAGLCLYPDRYRISYDNGPPIGPSDSPVRISVRTQGPVPIPSGMPEVVWRAGIDLNPLDVRDPDDLAWLSACIWPEHHQRRHRLTAAAAIVAAEPPELLRGDLVDRIDELIASAPSEATTVVFHSAVLGYLSAEDRSAFARRMGAHPAAVWISNEGPGVVDGLATHLTPPDHAAAKAFFVLGVAGHQTVAISDPHGTWLTWTSAKQG